MADNPKSVKRCLQDVETLLRQASLAADRIIIGCSDEDVSRAQKLRQSIDKPWILAREWLGIEELPA